MRWLRQWRRKKITARRFPPAWEAILEDRVPVYSLLPPEDRRELQGHVLVFLAEKSFEGIDGLSITDEVRLVVAAQACILLLHRCTDYFPGLRSIVVRPGPFVGRRVEYFDSGFVIEGPEERSGEAWHRGPIVLSWDDVLAGAEDCRDGYNVVFHEFAHQIDATAGRGDRSGVLDDPGEFRAWSAVLRDEYRRLRREVRRQRETFLDDYAATSPSEFFAVATEYFFEMPRELDREHPELYRALSKFYQQDPARTWNW